MKRLALVALLTARIISSALAQETHAEHAGPAPAPSQAADPRAGQQMAAPAENAHARHTMPTSSEEGGATGAEQPVGDAPAPAVIRDSAADRVFGVESMARARDTLNDDHGGDLVSKVMANIVEYQNGGGYRWDVETRYGGDLNRFVFKTEGSGGGSGAESAETQALYSRSIARYTDLQAGVRYDVKPSGRTYATVGIESLFPYWFQVETALFLSDRGDILARFKGTYDVKLTQRLILQPRAEIELSAQDIPEPAIGSGVSSAELGLRLRYEVRRELAPYVGISVHRSYGGTADFARSAGKDVTDHSVVIGLRAWF